MRHRDGPTIISGVTSPPYVIKRTGKENLETEGHAGLLHCAAAAAAAPAPIHARAESVTLLLGNGVGCAHSCAWAVPREGKKAG